MAVDLAPTPVVTTPTTPVGNVAPVVPGNADTSQPVQGSGTQNPVTSTPAANGQNNNPWSGLNEDNLTWVKSKGWADPNATIKSHRELETAYSKRHEEVRTFKPDEYKLAKPADLPAGMPYDDKFTNAFVEQAAKIGIAPKQAEALHGWFTGVAASGFQAQMEAEAANTSAAVSAAEAALKAKWGDPATPTFQRNLELAQRALRLSDPALKAAMQKSGAIKVIGGAEKIADAGAFEALAKMGGAMFAEDSIHAPVTEANNPFADATENLAAQGRIIQENPEQARALIRQAGAKAIARNEWWMNRPADSKY